ncbi:MAG: hypothetical protein A4S09_10575 [Proteobacteria bacterium SG_bin7]|nr:MAG: hypothetical protein A4S09_10575 [Proteobacteria bacterium SG_bin7]
MRNERGFLTLDFIFALVIVVGFSIVLFAISFTLSIVEITQYISFSSARSYYAGHLTPNDQIQLGIKKYQELLDQPAFKPLFRPGGWFELQTPDGAVGDYNRIYTSKGARSTTSGFTYFGSRIKLIANIMDLRFPIIGATSDRPGAFSANVASYISREPTEQECRDNFEVQRYLQILSLSSVYQAPGNDGKAYVPMMDNGC